MTFLMILAAMSVSGCAAVPRTILYQATGAGVTSHETLDRALWENAIKPDENLSNSTLMSGDLASYHLIQVNGAEKPHKHEFHDLAVFIQSGSGTMFLGQKSFKVEEGAIIFIPHGVTHYFVNTGPTPAVAIAVFSPPYDGKDNVPVRTGN